MGTMQVCKLQYGTVSYIQTEDYFILIISPIQALYQWTLTGLTHATQMHQIFIPIHKACIFLVLYKFSNTALECVHMWSLHMQAGLAVTICTLPCWCSLPFHWYCSLHQTLYLLSHMSDTPDAEPVSNVVTQQRNKVYIVEVCIQICILNNAQE